MHGRGSAKARPSKRKRAGYTDLHVAVDDYSRVAYVEAHNNETTNTLIGLWQRAQGWFWANDMAVDEFLTDNGANLVSDKYAVLLAERAIVLSDAPNPTGPKPTAKQSASTAPSQKSSSTPASSDPKPTAADTSPNGSTTTTATDTTLP